MVLWVARTLRRLMAWMAVHFRLMSMRPTPSPHIIQENLWSSLYKWRNLKPRGMETCPFEMTATTKPCTGARPGPPNLDKAYVFILPKWMVVVWSWLSSGERFQCVINSLSFCGILIHGSNFSINSKSYCLYKMRKHIQVLTFLEGSINGRVLA